MDFITKFPRNARGNDAIWVIVDRLTKSAHFLAINESSSVEKLCSRGGSSTWGADFDCVGPRCTFYLPVMEEVSRGVGYPATLQ